MVHGCWFANKGGEMKSLYFDEIMEFIWFSYDFSKSARACFVLKKMVAKTLGLYMFSSRAILKSLGNWWFWQDFDMRARRSAHVAFMVLFDRDSTYVVHGCWCASKGGEMKSLDSNKKYGNHMIFV